MLARIVGEGPKRHDDVYLHRCAKCEQQYSQHVSPFSLFSPLACAAMQPTGRLAGCPSGNADSNGLGGVQRHTGMARTRFRPMPMVLQTIGTYVGVAGHGSMFVCTYMRKYVFRATESIHMCLSCYIGRILTRVGLSPFRPRNRGQRRCHRRRLHQ